VSCVSQAVKNLLAERFKISPERLVVVHNAVGDHFRQCRRKLPVARWRKAMGLNNPTFCYVGKLQACKNIVRILETSTVFVTKSI